MQFLNPADDGDNFYHFNTLKSYDSYVRKNFAIPLHVYFLVRRAYKIKFE